MPTVDFNVSMSCLVGLPSTSSPVSGPPRFNSNTPTLGVSTLLLFFTGSPGKSREIVDAIRSAVARDCIDDACSKVCLALRDADAAVNAIDEGATAWNAR